MNNTRSAESIAQRKECSLVGTAVNTALAKFLVAKMQIEIEDSKIRALLKQVMQAYPEASAGNCLVCTAYDYEKVEFTFTDTEEDKEHKVNLEQLMLGFQKLFMEINSGKLRDFNGTGLLDPNSWDGVCVDALVQCSIFGEVIYG